MASKLDMEARMTIKSLSERGQSNRAIARLLNVHENTIRYHLKRQQQGSLDGRANRSHWPPDSRKQLPSGSTGSTRTAR